MAGEKASVDRDKSYDLINPFTGQPQSAPDAERETAYHDQDEVTGTQKHEDPYNNDDEVYNGIKKDTSRIADNRDSLGDAVKKGHMKKLSETTSKINPRKNDTVISTFDRKIDRHSAHRKAVHDTRKGPRNFLKRLDNGGKALDPSAYRPRTIREAENPMVASAPATSDSPMLGMYSMNPNNSNGSKYNLRSILESIALQAAETFEALDENATIPDAFGSELDQCSKALNKLYSFVTQGQQDPQTGTTPVQGQNFMTKESYLNEGTHIYSGMVRNKETGKEHHWKVPMSNDDIENFDEDDFSEKLAHFNPHLNDDHIKAIVDSGGEPENHDHPKYTVHNFQESYGLEETAKSEKFKKDTAALAGHPGKLEPVDFKTLRQNNEEAKAKAKMAEAAYGVFAHILRNGR